ncbi:hypothetical protein OQY15_18305 [Pedobacter sp. MC2016-15]|uniref:hypothetical protein n=1 Tax=Pedobacter sp. MC2016-15 TaxID=2994473 RepID=UPI002246C04A|nr:hypothetical protein [Pedobacter sp. MC2016-15]MCX2481063.1 hypothetical protein [Pedobacter sp. MC2016-15]
MKNLKLKTNWLMMVALPCLMMVLLMTSCGKDDDNNPETGNSYPRDVNVEYRVTTTSGLKNGDVIYTNETGGNAIVDNVTLPYSVKFKKNVKQFDNLAINFSAMTSGDAKAEILVNDKVVETKTFSGTSIITGSAVYIFQ